MKKLITILLLAGVVSSAHAKLGDILFVAVDGAELKVAPSESADVKVKLPLGNKLLEFSRDGSWVNVGADGTGGMDGWIKLESVSGSKPAGAKRGAAQTPAFKEFHSDFVRFSMMLKMGGGSAYFGEALFLGDGIVEVEVTDRFLSRPEKVRMGLLYSLVELWSNAERPGLPVWVHLLDAEGNDLMRGGVN